MKQSEYERTYRLEDRHWWFVGRRRLAAALIERWVKPAPHHRILDVGCGTGGNLALLKQAGRATGVDLSPWPLDFARRRRLPQLVQASALDLPHPSNTFYLATAFDVLYHCWITDDERVIRELYRLLQPGGWLLVTDSALPALWSSHDQFFYSRQRYQLAEMEEKLSRAGFTPRLCSHTNTLLLPVMAVIRLAMRWLPIPGDTDLRPIPGWLNRLFIAVRDLEVVWLRRNGTFPVGSSLICLVQKPTGGQK